MEYVLPDGSMVRGMATIVIDARGVVTCHAEMAVTGREIYHYDYTKRTTNGFCSEEQKAANRAERNSNKSYGGAVRTVKGYRDTERVAIER